MWAITFYPQPLYYFTVYLEFEHLSILYGVVIIKWNWRKTDKLPKLTLSKIQVLLRCYRRRLFQRGIRLNRHFEVQPQQLHVQTQLSPNRHSKIRKIIEYPRIGFWDCLPSDCNLCVFVYVEWGWASVLGSESCGFNNCSCIGWISKLFRMEIDSPPESPAPSHSDLVIQVGTFAGCWSSMLVTIVLVIEVCAPVELWLVCWRIWCFFYWRELWALFVVEYD